MAISKKNLGFTLIEILIVVTALALLMVAGGNLLFGSLLGSSKSEILKEVKQNGEFALKIINDSIINASKLELCDSKTLTIKNQNNQTITFKVINDQNNIPRLASNSSYLTSNKVKITNLSFICPSEEEIGSPPTIGINFTVSQAQETDRPEKKASLSFSAVATMRNY